MVEPPLPTTPPSLDKSHFPVHATLHYRVALIRPQSKVCRNRSTHDYPGYTGSHACLLLCACFSLPLSSGEVTQYKGRLVDKGYSQLWGIDVYASFMPAPAGEVLRTVLAYTAHQDWELCHGDVHQGFLQADMEEDIDVRLRDGCGVWSGKIVKNS
ncbi:unnamed protein product [Discosporangium mesarthrocarpum]